MENAQPLVMIVENPDENLKISPKENLCLPIKP
jgi:hypothetical protein